MLPHNITYLYTPFTPPMPPGASLRVAIRILKSLIARWQVIMSREHREYMPIIVPLHWTVEKTLFAAAGQLPQPVDTVASIRKRMDSRMKRIGMVQYADMAVGQLGAAA